MRRSLGCAIRLWITLVKLTNVIPDRVAHFTRFLRASVSHANKPPLFHPKMSSKSRNSIEQEGRILLAISAYKESQIPTVRQAARHFQVPESTPATASWDNYMVWKVC